MRQLSKEDKDQLLGAGLLALVGILFLIIGICLLTSALHAKARCDTEVPAVVVEMKGISSGRATHKHTTYAPVLAYEYNGQSYTYTSRSGSRPPKYTAGQALNIMIDSDAPEIVYMPTDSTDFILFGCIIAGGLLFGGFGIIYGLHHIRHDEDAEQTEK